MFRLHGESDEPKENRFERRASSKLPPGSTFQEQEDHQNAEDDADSFANNPSPTPSVMNLHFAPSDIQERPSSAGSPSAQSESGSDLRKDLQSEILVNWLHQKQEERLWYSESPDAGVFIKKSKGCFVCCPASLQTEASAVYQAVSELDAPVSTTCLLLLSMACIR